MRKLPSRKLLATIVAGALFLPSSGFTLGLGEIEVNSALNQKLRADIELLSATPEDAENIIVKLASRKEFSRAGLDRPYSLSDLRFKSEVIDGVPHIKVSTGSPVREPFLNFLIEIDWPNGHLLREYTVLLDPPVFMTKSAVDTAESRPASPAAAESRPASSGVTTSGASAINVPVPVTAASNSSSPVESSQAAPARTFTPAPVVQQQTPVNQQSINQPPGSYRIKSGDTSWSLADAMRPNQSITVPQMMIAMLRANPESFINENINGLKRGYILRVPDAEQIAAISQADAQALMREHWALWRQHQQAKSSEQPVSAMQTDGSTSVSGTTSETSQTADNAHLSIVSAGSGTSSAGTKDPSEMTAQELRTELAASRERVETERVEKEALQSRINALEQNIGEREGLLTIEDEGLSGVQSLSTTSDTADSDTDVSEPVVDNTDSKIEGEVVTDAGESQDTQSDAIDDTAVTDNNSMTAEQESDSTTDAVFTDEVTASAVEEQTADDGQISDEMPEQTAATDIAASQPASDESVEVNPLAQLLDDPKLLAVAGGGLLLIVALIALMIKRRKSGEDDEPEVTNAFVDLESLADEIAEENALDDTVVDSTEGIPEVDSDDIPDDEDVTEVAGIDDEEKTAVTEDDAPRDDVIAEADVYLAYGIYQQAEDLLNQAIAENPDRNDYRFKLAETHYASKNAAAFAEVAGELKGRIEDEDSADWNKLQVMGQDICADDPMFKSADMAELDLDASVADGPIMELDDGSNEGDSMASSNLDLTMDDTLDLPEMNAEESETDQLDDVADENGATEPVEEIEFDITDTDAIEESDAIEDEFDLDIDVTELDIDNQSSSDSMDDSEAENTTSEDTAEIEEESMDLGEIDLGLDEDETVAELSADEVHELADVELQDTEMQGADLQDTELEDTDLDFGLDDSVSEVGNNLEIEEEAAELDLSEEIASETSDDESVAEITADDAIVKDSEQSDDTSDTAFDTVSDEPAETAQTIPAANDDSADEDDFDLSSLDDVDEISTKLDLARAYLDMGDAEGTRGILEEVLIDGNDEQKQEANDLLDKLA